MGYIYALTNESMPGLIKIGMTDRTVHERIKELNNSTGVPTPFLVSHFVEVHDALSAEQSLHKRFNAHRVNNGREFFKVPMVDVIAAMDEFRLDDDAEPEVEIKHLTPAEQKAEAKRRWAEHSRAWEREKRRNGGKKPASVRAVKSPKENLSLAPPKGSKRKSTQIFLLIISLMLLVVIWSAALNQ